MRKRASSLSTLTAIGLCASSCTLMPSPEELYGPAAALCVSGERLYACAGESVVLLDPSPDGDLALVGVWTSSGGVHDVEVAGDRAFVAAAQRGLVVLDLSQPAQPVAERVLETGGAALGVRLLDGRLLVEAEGAELVVDREDWSVEPLERGSGTAGDPHAGSCVAGDLRYRTDLQKLYVEDLSHPAAPALLGSCPLPLERGVEGRTLVVVAGGLAFTSIEQSLYEEHLAIVDVRDPRAPRGLGHVLIGATVDEPIEDVVVLGRYAYVAAGYGGIRVVDISDPGAPAIVGTFETSTQR